VPEGAPGRGHRLLGCNMLAREMFRKGGWWTAVDGGRWRRKGQQQEERTELAWGLLFFLGFGTSVPTFCTSSAHPMCSEQGYSVCQNHHTNTNSLAFLKAA
jgi:hypothetical protein